MTTKPKNISKEILEELYIKKGMTMKEICKELNVSQPLTIAKYMKKHGVEVRDVNHERSLTYKLKTSEKQFKDLLFKEYIGKQMSQNELAEKYGVSHVIIARYLKKYNIPMRDHKEANKINNTGFKSSRWSGERKIASNGYVIIVDPAHPTPIRNNYVYEHRLVMEKHLGRYLDKKEIVHHINGNKIDNRIENLELMTHSEHSKFHAIDHIPHMNQVRKDKMKPVI